MSAVPDLPPPDALALDHSARLVDRIRDEIERHDGWMSFERFMEMALYEPGLGYYSAGSRKLGADGDFVTAPEISSLFSRCLAAQCAEVLATLGTGDILELGAGSGIMAADVLAELRDLGRLPGRYLILEVSADLRERQRETLAAKVPDLVDRVTWLDAAPAPFVGVILANEVLDALPVQRFRIRGPHVNTLGVSWQLGRLDWSEIRAERSLEKTVRSIELTLGASLPDGYTSEVNQRLAPWLQTLAQSLERGVMLFIDYGLPRAQYYRDERMTGTLLCHYRHRFHDDPFVFPGLQDIGAWVDFSAVAHCAVDAGLAVAGFTTQAHFLIGTGIDRLLAGLADREIESRLQVARQVMVLTLPGEMGERFKVLGLARDYDGPLCGFSVRDLAGSL